MPLQRRSRSAPAGLCKHKVAGFAADWPGAATSARTNAPHGHDCGVSEDCRRAQEAVAINL